MCSAWPPPEPAAAGGDPLLDLGWMLICWPVGPDPLGSGQCLSALGGLASRSELLDAYELEMLPLSKNLRPRSLGVYARRWREAVEAARLLVKHKVHYDNR